MSTLTIVILSIATAFYLFCQVSVCVHCTLVDMVEDFWESQNIFGKILANVFYAPTWVIKVSGLTIIKVFFPKVKKYFKILFKNVLTMG